MSKDNVVKFPKKKKRSKSDKQFLELEHQASLIEQQRKDIMKLLGSDSPNECCGCCDPCECDPCECE